VIGEEFADTADKLDGYFHHGVRGGFVSGFIFGNGFFV
jgi:hypothetical protein